ncbi:hypothetical protein BHY_1572 (plasmid) [Borrelia nietonii YOR]|uniref:Variable outer membrane protein n=1 Tax=Borrelia nietonii YOR TaxID=1293576 RepID=W5SC59_9SPIR|nr:hypothetical protein BHY_1572 [Borrelia nietonii YOR]
MVIVQGVADAGEAGKLFDGSTGFADAKKQPPMQRRLLEQ